MVDGSFYETVKIIFLNDGIYKYASQSGFAVGGAERQQWLLARALACVGQSVVVGVCDGLEAGAQETIDNVRFIGIGKGFPHVLAAWARFLALERPAWWYWRCASHLLGPAVAMAKVLGVRTAFSVALDSDLYPRRASVQRPNWWFLYSLGLTWVDRILLQHRGQFVELPQGFHAKSFIVPSIAGETVSAKSHFQRPGYVAWVGQLKHPKRPDRLLNLAEKVTEVRFVVCGGHSTFLSPPGYSESIIDRLQRLPNVEYRGQVSAADASAIIANASVLLSTAENEGFPNTFLQAWSAGTPVVSIGLDPGDVITGRKLGYISRSVDGAVDALKSLDRSAQTREQISVRARRYVAEYHSEFAVVEQFNRAIEGVHGRVSTVGA